jgi:hypothetical protein
MATNVVENNISMRETFPSSPEKDFENGSVWYTRKPLDVPVYGHQQYATMWRVAHRPTAREL